MCIRDRSWFADSKEHNMIHTFYNEKQNKDVYMVALRDEDGELLGYYEKHEFRTVSYTHLSLSHASASGVYVARQIVEGTGVDR